MAALKKETVKNEKKKGVEFGKEDENKPKLRIFSYARCSTEEQVHIGLSVPRQQRTIREYCQFNNIEIVEEFKDEGVSGCIKFKHRPDSSILWSKLLIGKAEGIIVSKLDRLSRSMYDFVNLSAEMGKRKLTLILVQENCDTSTPSGRFMLNLMACIAELEREKTKERVLDSIRDKKKRGMRTGQIPWGKKLVKDEDGKDTQLLEDDLEEMETIRIVKEMRDTIKNKKELKSGKIKYAPITYCAIGKELERMGRKNKEGRSVFPSATVGRLYKMEFNGESFDHPEKKKEMIVEVDDEKLDDEIQELKDKEDKIKELQEQLKKLEGNDLTVRRKKSKKKDDEPVDLTVRRKKSNKKDNE